MKFILRRKKPFHFNIFSCVPFKFSEEFLLGIPRTSYRVSTEQSEQSFNTNLISARKFKKFSTDIINISRANLNFIN